MFLCLPGSPFTDAGGGDFAVQKLAANLHHLRGQLMLAAAITQAQRATISAQEETIALHRRLLSDDVLINSLRDEDREQFLGGTVAITKYAGKGFEINLPEIFRRFRERFGRKIAG